MTYRQKGESARCEFCGGGDMHAFDCPDPSYRAAQCIGRRRVAGQIKTVRCNAEPLPGKALCEVCTPGMCERHPAFEADNCPACGTGAKI